jgi:hypothetical protein
MLSQREGRGGGGEVKGGGGGGSCNFEAFPGDDPSLPATAAFERLLHAISHPPLRISMQQWWTDRHANSTAACTKDCTAKTVPHGRQNT